MVWAGYMDNEALADAIGDDTGLHTAEIERAILGASGLIDRWAGRTFYQPLEEEERSFLPRDRHRICVGDFDDPTAMTVEVRAAGGDWEPLDPDLWQPLAEPRSTGWHVRDLGEPWRYIATTTRSTTFTISGLRPTVRVTGVWGWPAVPGPIEQACQTLASIYYRGKDTSGTETGIDYVGREEISADPFTVAMQAVRPFAVPGGELYKPPPGLCTRCAA